jgi:hypothetical protein
MVQIRPKSAAGFRLVNMEDCNRKCKCFCGENKGVVYNIDEPCLKAGTFDKNNCTCGPYNAGPVFYYNAAALDGSCYPGQQVGCCCGRVRLYESTAGNNDYGLSVVYEPPNSCSICPVEKVPATYGCVESVSFANTGWPILSYEQPRAVFRTGSWIAGLNPKICPDPVYAQCDTQSWNSFLGTDADYVVVRSGTFPFWELWDARASGNCAEFQERCCPDPEVYGCPSGYRDYKVSVPNVRDGGVGSYWGASELYIMEATVLFGVLEFTELKVVFLATGLYGGSRYGSYITGAPSIARKMVAVKIPEVNGTPGNDGTIWAYGSQEVLDQARAEAKCEGQGCRQDRGCPASKRQCPAPPPSCTRCYRGTLDNCKYCYYNPHHWRSCGNR